MGETLRRKLALVISADNRQALTGLGQVDRALGGIDRTLRRLVLSAAGFFGAWKLAGFIKDATLTAARTEVLGTALAVVGKQAGYSTVFLGATEVKIKALGITTQEARVSMTRFIQSNLDLADASRLARVAQDLAVISGQNSSEAFETLTQAIVSQHPMLLRQFGIVAHLGDIYDKYAKTIGKTSDTLTEVERKQAFMNIIFDAGSRVAGVYEAAMGDVGKQLTSLPRYWQEMQNAIGRLFLPIMIVVVDWVKRFSQTMEGIAKGDAGKRFREFIEKVSVKLKEWGQAIIDFVVKLPQKVETVTSHWLFKLVTSETGLMSTGLIWVLTKAIELLDVLNSGLKVATGTTLLGALGSTGSAIGRLGMTTAGTAIGVTALNAAALAPALAPVVVAIMGTLGMGWLIYELSTRGPSGPAAVAGRETGRGYVGPYLQGAATGVPGMREQALRMLFATPARMQLGPPTPIPTEPNAFLDWFETMTGLPITRPRPSGPPEMIGPPTPTPMELAELRPEQMKWAESWRDRAPWLGQQMGPEGQMSMPDLIAQYDERFRINQEFKERMSEADLVFGETGLNNAKMLHNAEIMIARDRNGRLLAVEREKLDRMGAINKRLFAITEETLGRHLGNIVLWRRTSLKEILRDLTESAAQQLAMDAVVWALEGWVLGDPRKIAGAAKAAALAGVFGAAAVALGANEGLDAAREQRTSTEDQTERSGRRTGTVVTGQEQTIYISPSLSLHAETIIVGPNGMEALESLADLSVEAIKSALGTGEIAIEGRR